MSSKALTCWFKMRNIKDCQRPLCFCADKLRELTLKLPISNEEEIKYDKQLKKFEDNYIICYNSRNEMPRL